MLKGRVLYEVEVENHSKLAVYGLFNTKDATWLYFVISFYTRSGSMVFSQELCDSVGSNITEHNVSKNSKEFKSLREGADFIKDYKMKWETGLNDYRSIIREEKLESILDKKNEEE